MYNIKETDLGTVRFDEKVISDMVSNALDDYTGRVWLGDYGSRRIFKSGAEESFIDVEWDEQLKVTVYVILKFGTSISSITISILEEIRNQLSEALGDINMKLRIVVTGVQVREQIAKRHIEVEL